MSNDWDAYEVEAGLIFKLHTFISWPAAAFPQPDDRMLIGIVGRDPFRNFFDPIEGSEVDGKTITLRKFDAAAPIEELKACHLLYINTPEQRMKEILSALQKEPVFTIGDADNFIDYGGIFGFVTKGQNISYEMNKTALELSGLRVRAQLLRLAIRLIEQK